MCVWVLVLSDCGKVLPISVTASLRLSVSVRLCPSLSHISFIKWQHDICKWNFPSTHLAAAAVVVVAAAAVGVAAAAAAIAAIDSQTDRLTFKQHSALHLHLPLTLSSSSFKLSPVSVLFCGAFRRAIKFCVLRASFYGPQHFTSRVLHTFRLSGFHLPQFYLLSISVGQHLSFRRKS